MLAPALPSPSPTVLLLSCDPISAGKSYKHIPVFLLNSLPGSKAARLQWIRCALHVKHPGWGWKRHWKTPQSTLATGAGTSPWPEGTHDCGSVIVIPSTSSPHPAPHRPSWVTAAPWNDSLPMEWPSHTPHSLLVQPGEQGIAPWQPSAGITHRAQAAKLKDLLWWLPPACHSLGMHSASWQNSKKAQNARLPRNTPSQGHSWEGVGTWEWPSGNTSSPNIPSVHQERTSELSSAMRYGYCTLK